MSDEIIVVDNTTFLKELRDNDYLRVSPDYDNPAESKLLTHIEKQVKVGCEKVNISQTIETVLPIYMSLCDSVAKPKSFNLHRFDMRSVLTILEHKPYKLFIEYYTHNDNDLLREESKGLHCETLLVHGFRKQGKRENTYTVGLNRVYQDMFYFQSSY